MRSGTTMPIRYDCFVINARANWFGRYFIFCAVARMRARVSLLISGWLLIARDTVIFETLRARAMSSRVTVIVSLLATFQTRRDRSLGERSHHNVALCVGMKAVVTQL